MDTQAVLENLAQEQENNLTHVVILVGIPALKNHKVVAEFPVLLPHNEKVWKKRANECRREVVHNFRDRYYQFGIPYELSGFSWEDFYWAVFLDPSDMETLQLCSENYYESNHWRKS